MHFLSVSAIGVLLPCESGPCEYAYMWIHVSTFEITA